MSKISHTKIKKESTGDCHIEWVHVSKNLTEQDMVKILSDEMYEMAEKALRLGAELEVNATNDGASPVAYFTMVPLPLDGEPYTEKHVFI